MKAETSVAGTGSVKAPTAPTKPSEPKGSKDPREAKAQEIAKQEIAKLVKKFVQTEGELVRLAFQLKTFRELRQEVKNQYLNATLNTPEQVADYIWGLCVDGTERADGFDEILLALPYEARQFHVADCVLEWCKERGWSEQVQEILNQDAKDLLAQRTERHNTLLKSAGVEAEAVN